MRNINRHTVKSITRKALLVSMVLHVFLLIALFYFSITDQPLLFFQDKIDATIETLPKPTQSKVPIKTPILQERKTTIYEAPKPLDQVESINPNIVFQPNPAPTSPIVTEELRLKHVNTVPDVQTNISTAVRELRQVENGLSKTEAAEPTLGSGLGSKRSGGPSVQRRPIRTNVDVAKTIVNDDIPIDEVPTQKGDIQGSKTSVPYVPFGNVMQNLASEILETSKGKPIDVVFVIDASGSMGDNINAVAFHLTEMIDVYKSSGVDYALGLTKFAGRKGDVIEVGQLTQELSEYQRDLYSIVPRGDENALDAIERTVKEMQFRATSKKHLILVTDEPLTSLNKLTVQDSITLCREFGIYVNVLSLPGEEHKLLASETNGKWHAIPEDPKRRQAIRRRSNSAQITQNRARSLRKAEWQNAQKIGKILLQNAGNTPVDIVLLIDGSKSMEDKHPQFLEQLDIWTRDWDNALIDYQMGVVRFRARGAFNIVNVYNPPQSLDQIRKIAELPCQEDENLLHAIKEGLRRIKLRPKTKTHLIIVTDEPINKNASSLGIIQFLEEKQVVVSVLGTYDDFQPHVTIKTGGVWVPIPEGYTTNNKHR